MKAYEEVVDFIASGTTPGSVISFKPSESVKRRVTELIWREKNNAITEEEKSELDNYLHLEHLLRLAKARAREYFVNE